MADLPSSASRSVLTELVAFGRDLARTASAEDAVEQLLACVSTILGARQSAASWTSTQGVAPLIRTRPPSPNSREQLLSLAKQIGPTLLNSASSDLLRRVGGTLTPEEAAFEWILVLLVTGAEPTGALAIGSEPGNFSSSDLATAQALAAFACLTLQRIASAGVELPRPSWQEGLDAIAPALCLIDQTECIRRANRAFAWLVTTPPDGLIGRPWQSLVPPDWVPHLERAIRAEGINREVELRLGDRVYSASVAPLPGPSGADVVLVFDDQSDRHRLQDQLVQSEKMSAIGQLIAGVAHDLNNPLASVVGFAEFLAESGDVPPALTEPLRVIRQEAERAATIVKNLLSFARRQEGERLPQPLQPLLESVLALLRNEMMALKVETALFVEPHIPDIEMNPNQIKQVFVNLLNNAAQAIASTGRPGHITVSAKRWLDGVAVSVADDGPGIPEELLPRVFEPFFTTKTEGEGTGLGLSICQGIIKEHGGRITLESSVGVGATFTVELLSGSRPPRPSQPILAAVTSGTLRVLVVDDEPHILHYMRATLESWGHSVEVASDGTEAVERALVIPFDVIICDLRMPRLGGREMYNNLARQYPDIARKVIFATGDTVRGDTLQFLEQLGRPFLHKPFTLAELRTVLGNVAAGGNQ